VLCYGGNVFGWTLDEQKAFAVLDAFLDGGGNFIDTAVLNVNYFGPPN
jgi:aryl-alcohol dehydrogenase-like predicted oxidoreductase